MLECESTEESLEPLEADAISAVDIGAVEELSAGDNVVVELPVPVCSPHDSFPLPFTSQI